MELVDGETLAERIDRHAGGLPIAETIASARQIVDALEAAHERGMIHRDLKPANVKIRRDGVVKVLDFGLAKALEPPDNSANVGASTISLTSAQTVLGTPAYMSPEQARGQAVDQRTDIWAFGCVFYEMLTGRRAFSGSTSSDVIAAVLDRDLITTNCRRPRHFWSAGSSSDASKRIRDGGCATSRTRASTSMMRDT